MGKVLKKTLKESLADWISGKSRLNKSGPYIGRNDRTRVRRQKWEPKLSCEGKQLLPNGSIVNRWVVINKPKDNARMKNRR